MRSRCAAFVERDGRPLFRTLHRHHPNEAQSENTFIAPMKKHFAQRMAQRKRRGLDRAPADEQGVARVLFIAHLAQRGRDLSFAEPSLFAHDGMGVRYLAGPTMLLAELGARIRSAERSA